MYVFAVTQVTGYMAHEHSAHGALQGLLLLALVWWTWSAYTWLGNQARADEGVLRTGMVVAMAAIFVVALTIPEAWHDAPGGLNGPVVLVLAYLLVRTVHLAVYALAAAAAGDLGLRHQLAITLAPMLAGAAMLLTGGAARRLAADAHVGRCSRGGLGRDLPDFPAWQLAVAQRCALDRTARLVHDPRDR